VEGRPGAPVGTVGGSPTTSVTLVPDARSDMSSTTQTATESPGPAPTAEGKLVRLPLALAWVGMATVGLSTIEIGLFSLSDGAFIAAAMVVVTQLLMGDRRGLSPARSRRTPQLVLAGSVILLTAGAVSSLRSWDPAGSLLIVVRVGYLVLVWTWLLRAVTPTRAAVDVLLSGWRAGVVFVSTAAVLDQFGLIGISAENTENRQAAFSGHPNDLAGYLVVALPLAMLGLPRRRERSQRKDTTWRIVMSGLVIYAITTTGSITGLASAAVTAVVTFGVMLLVPSAKRRTKRRDPLVAVAFMVAAVVGLGLLATSDLPVFERIDRYETGDSYVTGSADQRADLNARVVGRFDEWLVTGVGLDRQSVNATDVVTERIGGGVHNMYLKILLEAGLPGLIGLTLILVATLRAALLLMTNTRRTALYPVIVLVTSSTLAACVFANFGPILYHRYFWVPIGLVWCVWSLRREELRRDGEVSVGPGDRAERGRFRPTVGPAGQPELGT